VHTAGWENGHRGWNPLVSEQIRSRRLTGQQCCGSESEIIRMFWLDPNPSKKLGFGYGFGFRHCCRMNIFVKNKKSNTWKRKILCFFFWKNFVFSDVHVPEHIWKQLEAPFRKIWGQNISLRIRIRIRKK
jgi:hypothetical protein